jgi:hypothetical protein
VYIKEVREVSKYVAILNLDEKYGVLKCISTFNLDVVSLSDLNGIHFTQGGRYETDLGFILLAFYMDFI